MERKLRTSMVGSVAIEVRCDSVIENNFEKRYKRRNTGSDDDQIDLESATSIQSAYTLHRLDIFQLV